MKEGKGFDFSALLKKSNTYTTNTLHKNHVKTRPKKKKKVNQIHIYIQRPDLPWSRSALHFNGWMACGDSFKGRTW